MDISDNTFVLNVDNDRLYNVREIALMMHTSRDFVYKLIKKDVLPSIRFGREHRVIKSSFIKFLHKYEGQNLHDLVGEGFDKSAKK